ncbi:MAG: hypothetical protein RLZZ230_887 [Candidatus Parcubacteria bacterium]|jgi:hypothetical protein
MKTTNGAVFVGNKKHSYILTEQKNNMIYVDCKAACVGQEFASEDVGALILDLPNLIEAEQSYQEEQSDTIRFRTTAEQRKKIESNAKASGKSVSKFVRDLALKV